MEGGLMELEAPGEEGAGVVTAQPLEEKELPPEGFLVQVPKAESKIDASGSYMTYAIESIFGPDNALGAEEGSYAVFRRYNEFVHLVEYLRASLPYVVVPPIPEKKTNFKWKQLAVDITDEVFVGKRRLMLEDFLRRCLDHPLICHDQGFHAFLMEQEWKEDLVVRSPDGETHPFTGSEWLSSLRALTVSRSANPPPLEVKHFKALSVSMEQHIGVILNTHATLAYKVQALLPLLKDSSEAFSALAQLTSPRLKAPLESVASRLMGIRKLTVRRLKHEERLFADTLYGFVGYVGSIAAFTKNEDLAYAALVRARDAHQAKLKTITALERPDEDKSFSGFFTRLATTEASKEGKLEALRQEAEQLRAQEDATQKHYSEFKEEALKEIRRFSVTKKHELISIFRDYARLQREYAKFLAKRWTEFRQAVAAPQPSA